MKSKLLCITTLLLVVVCFPATSQNQRQLFWISFQRIQTGVRWFQMLAQINDLGEITVRPTRITAREKFTYENTLFRDSLNRLNLWFSETHYVRFIIPLSNLGPPLVTPESIIRTRLQGSVRIPCTGVTRRAQRNFMTTRRRGKADDLYGSLGEIIAVNITSDGRFLPGIWSISSKLPDAYIRCGGVASDDGRVAFFDTDVSYHHNLYLQLLDLTGRPSGKPLHLDSEKTTGKGRIPAARVTGILPGNRRLVVYVVVPKSAGSSDDPDKLYVQAVDTNVTRKIGPRIPLHSRGQQFGFVDSVVIDPKGKFVLYVISDSHTLFLSLMYQPLMQDGHRAGKAKVILSNVLGGVDMVPVFSVAGSQ